MSGPRHQRAVPDALVVYPMSDPLVEAQGFAPRSTYVEQVWLPILGPTSTLLFRRLGTWAIQHPEGLTIDAVDLAVSLGLGESLAKNSALARGLGRLASFHAATWHGDEYYVRRALPPVPQRLGRLLSYSAMQAHEQVVKGASV